MAKEAAAAHKGPVAAGRAQPQIPVYRIIISWLNVLCNTFFRGRAYGKAEGTKKYYVRTEL